MKDEFKDRVLIVTQNKKSALFDILKREKLEKMMKRNSSSEQSQENEKPQTSENVPEKSSTEKKESQISKIYKAIEDVKLDIRYYFLQDEYVEKLASIYIKNEGPLEKLGIDPKKYLEYARDSFDRYKQLDKKMPLEPMNKKSWDHVEKSLNELITKLLEKFSK
ncbi:hypothetical protein LEP1GSC049_1693 [Leptospira kirschneri serovar Cynopteri str. 3522 CT]|uniref:Uncharacterized protein n=1 Tax=Leptospira kirschneri serovar Bulgarica str. Nikolaevo TaxID=1240687 RepID=M6F6H3_9LEPT|nr:hypothetical protein LEP1GSC018_2419 [Leptospira kirschneri str. 2008720114]EMK13739.1 hypothetical protein LEP1GSC042_3096 [Leptospira kirschneri serovar Bim str. PUO 1247]EMK22637.1 hypothetical protein LEP1GSC008_3494 [Leptospira kirschneri serovar Bulgarica str. Nikolaevo]EMN03207.1 hypothetical protein LEP1GSC046_3227 [Leptospira kirschneri serovar Bim str. 1051]EPG51185.1 hypothetical protein LEP1GSC049_1693 [Leptospira kirschneri serovar Cynopteri str. 3522 CT]